MPEDNADLKVGQPCYDQQWNQFVTITGHAISNVYVVRAPGGMVYETPRSKLAPIPDSFLVRADHGSKFAADADMGGAMGMLNNLGLIGKDLRLPEPGIIAHFDPPNPLAELLKGLPDGTFATITLETRTGGRSCDKPC